MFGLFGLFGRSRAIRRLDDALLAAGVHPRALPDAVKLSVLRLLGGTRGDGPLAQDCSAAAELVGYCVLGAQGFLASAGLARTEAVEARIEAALAAGDSADARLLLLTLHSGTIQASVVDRYDLAVETEAIAD